MIIFFCCIFLMVLISFFTTPVPLDALGALTWPTINNPRYRGGKSKAEYVVNSGDHLELDRVTNAHGPSGEGMFHVSCCIIVIIIINFSHICIIWPAYTLPFDENTSPKKIGSY